MQAFDHSPEQAEAYADAARARMKAAGVAATPPNFEIFYAYAANANAELVRALDVVMSNRQAFTPERLAEIHALYFESSDADAERLAELSRKIEETLTAAAADVDAAGQQAGAFGGRIADLADRAEAGGAAGPRKPDGAAALPQLVKALVREAREMAAHSRAVGQRLGQSRRTVETLRSSLTEMRHAAETDALTGLPNRRVLEQALTDGAAQAMETGGTLCFALLDIDHFKAFNDTHGHLVGDQVLKLVAKVLGEETRDSDVVARWGGEEFAILMPDTELTGGRELAERIRERVAARRLTKRKTGEVIGQITLSLGLAAYDFGEPLERLTKRADQCLYAAKTAGRNRVLTDAETAEGLVEA